MPFPKTLRNRLSGTSRRILALVVLPASLTAILLFAGIHRRAPNRPLSVPPPSPVIPVEEGGSERAKSIRDFNSRHSREVGVQLDSLINRDPTYPNAINRVTPEHVQSLEGFTEAEKQALLETVRAAQTHARNAKPESDTQGWSGR